ncbi:hypothetical protein C2S51_010574 [Perilla frutescens var. frutescens]|nr:hypothetical protein C2S51_010574 [Perilla frutescens var. frutescens]
MVKMANGFTSLTRIAIKEKNQFYCRNCSTYTMDDSMRECMQVIKKFAAKFNFDVNEGANDLDVLEEIENDFLRKRFMLKIKVQGGENRTYNSPDSVLILIDDPNIISAYSTKLLDSQESNTISVLESSNVVADNMFGNSAIDSDAIVEVGSELLEEKTLKRGVYWMSFLQLCQPRKLKLSSSRKKAS